MKRTRVEVLLIGLTVLALSAGVVAGFVVARMPARNAPVAPADGMPPPPAVIERNLAEELDLSKDQRDKLRVIWEGARDQLRRSFGAAQGLQKDRDDALLERLNLTDAQKAEFAKISQEFAVKYDTIVGQRDKAFEGAVDQTKRMLNPDQVKKYEAILKTHVRPPSPPGPVGFSATQGSIPVVSGSTQPVN